MFCHVERDPSGASQDGQRKRISRDVTPLALVVACLSTLGASKATWLADIPRTFDAFTGLSIRYKPFHNQLRKAAFPEFMRRPLERILEN